MTQKRKIYKKDTVHTGLMPEDGLTEAWMEEESRVEDKEKMRGQSGVGWWGDGVKYVRRLAGKEILITGVADVFGLNKHTGKSSVLSDRAVCMLVCV